MVTFWQSLVVRVGFIILVIQLLASGIIVALYITEFSNAISSRAIQRLHLISELIQDETFDVQIIGDNEVLAQLIGEDVQQSFIVNPEGQIVLYSLEPDDLGKMVTELDEDHIPPAWFDTNDPTIDVRMIDTVVGESLSALIPIIGVNGDIRFFLYLETTTNSIMQEEQGILQLILGATALNLLVSSFFYFISLNRLILNPINQLVQTVQHVQKGNLQVQVPVTTSKNEWYILQTGFNDMILRLYALVNDLETRVAERTRDLQFVAEVSQKTNQILDIEILLPTLVKLTQEGFHFDDVTLYLYDRDQDVIHLHQSTTDTQHTLYKTTIPLSHGVPSKHVAKVSITRKPIIINQDEASGSELILPMITGQYLIGVLAIRSSKANLVSTTQVGILQVLAGQIAIAIRNAQLFSEINQARRVAEHADSVKSKFLAAMSHELRTPLNSVINFTQFVSRGIMGEINNDQKEVLEIAIRSAQHLLNLINDILDISKIESGELVLLIQDNIDVVKILQEVETTATALLKEKPAVTFHKEYLGKLPQIQCDRKRIIQVILNIISNACKFTEKGRVSLRAIPTEQDVLIIVQDSGPGIPTDEHETIFRAFHQSEHGIKSGQGTGLGLPISKELVEAHGGKLWLESVVGQGTTFYIQIPIHPPKDIL